MLIYLYLIKFKNKTLNENDKHCVECYIYISFTGKNLNQLELIAFGNVS